MQPHIGTLGEKSLHAALKQSLAQPGDLLEVPIEGFVIDILRGDLLIEIQTGGFTPLKRKFTRLLDLGRRIHLVYPVPALKWIEKQSTDGIRIERRRSPRRGRACDVFRELVRIPELLPRAGFSLEVALVQIEEIRVNDSRGSWRRQGWSLQDRRLLETIDRVHFETPGDYLQFLPTDLPEPFTNQALARQAGLPARLAQQMTYTLAAAGWIRRVGKQGNAHLYSRG